MSHISFRWKVAYMLTAYLLLYSIYIIQSEWETGFFLRMRRFFLPNLLMGRLILVSNLTVVHGYFSIPKNSNQKLWIQLLYKKYDTWSADVNTLIFYHYIHLILQKFYFSPLDNLLVSLVLTLLYVLPTLSSETSIKIQNVGNQSKQK